MNFADADILEVRKRKAMNEKKNFISR